ncbi:MAG: hypothetical protein ACTSUR_02530 [Candidatus Heimdallarchaeaceae archaeon]
MAVAQAEEKLGTFLTSSDLSQILAPTLRKQCIVKSYFINPEEDRIERIMDFVSQISNIFLEYYPHKLITEVLIQFQRFLPDFLDDYGPKRYFTKKHAANYFLALLDYRLTLVGSKLSPKHVDLVKELLELKGSKAFSFFSCKKVQTELLAAGYLQRRRREIYSPLLKNKVGQIVSDLTYLFPNFEENLLKLQEKAYSLIEEKIVPKIDIDDAALVLVISLIPYYIQGKRIMISFWIIIQEKFDIDIEAFKRKVYRFRSLLKKKDQESYLGLGKNVEDGCIGHGNTSFNRKFV